jgi:5-methylcytosine-specific restriction endonuclease McrA
MALPTLRPHIGLVDLRTAALPPKVAERFYSSAAWIALRDRVRHEANGRCQAQGCNRPGRIVDHIVELKDGGAPLDRSNTILLCASHHTAKTASERARRTARPGGL